MSTYTMERSTAHATTPKLSSEDEQRTRLPGFRQLFSHPLFASSQPRSSLCYPATPLPNAKTTTLALVPTFPSLPKMVPDSHIIATQPVHSNHPILRSQVVPQSGLDTLAPNHENVHPSQSSPLLRPHASPLQESWLSPQSRQESSAQSNQSGTPSPGSIYTNRSVSFESVPHQPSRSFGMDRHFPGPDWEKPPQDTPSHGDWGTTKAGKPRKRLAQACLNCRHKKIRCHPSSTSVKCTQCERTDLPCRFERGSRHAQSVQAVPDNPNPLLTVLPTGYGAMQLPIRSPGGEEASKFSKNPRSHHTLIEPHGRIVSPASSESPEGPLRPTKRQKRNVKSSQDRSEITQMIPETGLSSDGSAQPTNVHQALGRDTPSMTEGTDWTDDSISALTSEYLDLYFAHINQAIYCMFPKVPFLRWLRDCHEKTFDDKMILYTMMAMGCRFSAQEESVEHGKRLLQLARSAERSSFGKFTLQLVQTRLILALLNFSLGKSGEAWDYCGAAVTAVCRLKYNSEEGLTHQLDHAYGLNGGALAECRRRTFWSVYIMDRFNGSCSGHLSVLQNEHCFLCFPCREDLYELENVPDTAPFIKVDEGFTKMEQSRLGNMAYLIMMSSALSDVVQCIHRMEHRVCSTKSGAYESFYGDKQRHLQALMNGLPPHLLCNTENIEQALQGGYLGTIISLHALYHIALLTLNRYAVHDELEQGTLARNLGAAQYHARELLNLAHQISRLYREQDSVVLAGTFGPPVQGYAILSAVDVLTSIGTLADLESDLLLVYNGLEVVRGLSKYWANAQKQLRLISGRCEEIRVALEGASVDATHFVATAPLDEIFGQELDHLFLPPVDVRFNALGFGMIAKDESSVLTIQSLGSGIKGHGLSQATAFHRPMISERGSRMQI